MYSIQAVIATGPVLHELASALPGASIVPLAHGLSLAPMTDVLLDVLAKTPADLGSVLAACSTAGPVAYVEAEYFGGVGSQLAEVWDAGKVVLGPLHLAEGEPPSADGS